MRPPRLATALALAALATSGCGDSSESDPSEPKLGGADPAGATRTAAEAKPKKRAGKVTPLGGDVAPPAADDEDEPPAHILRENAELRRELKHLKELERERRKVSRLLLAAGVEYGPLVQGSGDLVWPVAGSVTSPFGQRWGRLHAGIDIAAGSGTVIYAAEAGRVVIAGWVGGYGRYTCVQHTRRLTTCYAHQSRFLARKGEAVAQGEALGLVGCTGHCFGDHLHFETWVAGRPVDPLRFL